MYIDNFVISFGFNHYDPAYMTVVYPNDYYPVDDVLDKAYALVAENGCQIAGRMFLQSSCNGQGNEKSWVGGVSCPE